MKITTPAALPDEAKLSSLSPGELLSCAKSLVHTVADLSQQLEWFKRQMFGTKSERLTLVDSSQLSLEQVGEVSLPAAPREQVVNAHRRRVSRPVEDAGATELFFDEQRVPVQVITLAAPGQSELSADQYEVVSEKVSYRLAQRPGSHVVLKYVRPVIKLRESEQLCCAAAPVGVIEGSRADVSFSAGLLVEKFIYHMPLYRQHQRLLDCGITVSRPWLTQVVQQSIGLLEPIYVSQLCSIRDSHLIAMDETPIKAGRSGKGSMKTGYLWPVYGDQDEICFPFFPSREAACVYETLGMKHRAGTVLLSDGYAAYKQYAERVGLVHAQCWAHARRELFEAQQMDPEAAQSALLQIQGIYQIEQDIRAQGLKGENKRLHRLTHSKPRVERLFEWIDQQFARQGLLPSNPFVKALAYARDRRAGLEVFLTDPEVPLDTNHVERALRTVAVGRKNWMFCWTELGAEHMGIVQSLVSTCRLHRIDPYTYLVDVLQRVGQHPASRVAELTPRLWKLHFADQPLRSDLYSATS